MVMINGTTVVIKFCRDGRHGLRKPVRRTDLESGSSISDRFLSRSLSALWQFKP